MPRLKPIEPRVQHQQRISVHERLGPRDSITNIDSAITIKVNNGPRRNRYKNLKRLNNQNDGRTSVQQRLNKNFVNPGIAARNNIINSWKLEKAVNAISDDEQHPIVARDFLTALTMRLMTTNPHKVEQIESKYNMNVQKEISEIQVSRHKRRSCGCAFDLNVWQMFFGIRRASKCITSVPVQVWLAAMAPVWARRSKFHTTKPACLWINDSPNQTASRLHKNS